MKSLDGPPASLEPQRLAEIRPFERADLMDAAALFEVGMRPGLDGVAPTVAGIFERTLLESPWADPELPSLVAVDEHGRIVGFLAAEVRRLRFGGEPVRAVSSQHFVVHPAARRLAVGAVLLDRLLGGPQDVTFTDTGSEPVRQMWERLGGQSLHLKSIHWIRVLRPWQVAAGVAGDRFRPRFQAALQPLAEKLDAATTAAAARYLKPSVSTDETADPLTAQTLLEVLPAVTERMKLYPDYDERFLDWLFAELSRDQRRGRVVANLVKTRSGRPLGWYVYYLRPGWRSEVMQVAASPRNAARVLDHLLQDAYANGSAAVRGRLEPLLFEAVARRRCLLWGHNEGGALVHSRDPELICAMHSDQSLVSRLDAEWWGSSFA